MHAQGQPVILSISSTYFTSGRSMVSRSQPRTHLLTGIGKQRRQDLRWGQAAQHGGRPCRFQGGANGTRDRWRSIECQWQKPAQGVNPMQFLRPRTPPRKHSLSTAHSRAKSQDEQVFSTAVRPNQHELNDLPYLWHTRYNRCSRRGIRSQDSGSPRNFRRWRNLIIITNSSTW